MEVDDKTQTHRLYRDLICSSIAYGAERWVVTLKRMCERFAYSMGETTPTREVGGGASSSLFISNPPMSFILIYL